MDRGSNVPLAPLSALGRVGWRLGWAGRWAIGLLGLHAALLFVPPLPPDVRGSLWSWLLAGMFVLLGTVEVASRSSSIASGWRGLGPRRRAAMGGGAALGGLALGLGLRAVSPELYDRWSRPEGVFEAVTVWVYLAAAVLLLRTARTRQGNDGRHLRFIAAGFGLLFLEEVDYLGIFGGLVGRVNGVYVGSAHDLLDLAVQGSMGLGLAALVAGTVIGLIVLLWRTAYLQPGRLLRSLASPTGVWFLGGAILIGVAQLEDVGLFSVLGTPSTEELLEMAGSLLWAGVALNVAAGLDPGAPNPGAPNPGARNPEARNPGARNPEARNLEARNPEALNSVEAGRHGAEAAVTGANGPRLPADRGGR